MGIKVDGDRVYGLFNEESEVAVLRNEDLQDAFVVLFSSEEAAQTYVADLGAQLQVIKLPHLEAVSGYLVFGRDHGATGLLFDPTFELDPETIQWSRISTALKTLPPPFQGLN